MTATGLREEEATLDPKIGCGGGGASAMSCNARRTKLRTKQALVNRGDYLPEAEGAL